jgi:hypothetical protein
VIVNVVPQASPGTGLESYLVQIAGTDGAAVSTVRAFELTGVHQVFKNAAAVPNTTPRLGDTGGTFGNASWAPVDTHLMAIPPSNTSPGFGIGETHDSTNPTGMELAADAPFQAFGGSAGIGTMRFVDTLNAANSLEATLAFLAPQPSTVDFLQVVIPAGAQANLKMFVEDSNVNGVAFDMMIGGVVVDPATGNPPAGSISGLLQGAFDSRTSGSDPAILPIMIMDGVVQSFDLVVDQPELSGFVQVEALAEVGKYNLVLSGPFETLDPGTILSGSLSFLTDNGNVDYTFSVNVPEPSTVALTGLAMVGFVGFLRRKSS